MNKSMRLAIFLCLMMIIQVTIPSTVIASTSPPSGPGNWTISSGETAYLNSSDQALVQGSVFVSGTLIINGGSLFLWGSSDGLRDIIVYSGGRLVIENGGILSSYTSVCFDMDVKPGASLEIDDGRIQEACYVQLQSNDWSLRDVHFEDSILEVEPPSNPKTASDGTPYLNWTIDGVDFVNITRGPVVHLQQGGLSSWSSTAKALQVKFENFTIEVDMYDQGSDPNYHTIQIDWQLSTHFNNGDIVDQSYSNSTGVTRYKDFGSKTGGDSYALYPALFSFSASVPWGSPHSLTNIKASDSHEHAFLYSNSQLELFDVEINNLLHPRGGYNYMNPRYGHSADSNMATVIIQSSSSISATNLSINNSAYVTDTNTYSSNNGVDVECHILRVSGTLNAQNVLVNNSCVSETVYSNTDPFYAYSYGSNSRSNSNYGCDALSPNLANSVINIHRLTTLGDTQYNSANDYCRIHSAMVAYVSGSISLTNFTVIDSANINVHFSSSSSSSFQYRHATTLAAVVFSEDGGEIKLMNVLNSGNSSTTSAYANSQGHLNSFSYVVALEGSSSSVLYVNNSDLNHSSIIPSCSQSYYNAQHWYALGVGTGTIVVTDTNISEISLPSSCSGHGSSGMAWLSSNGEFLRKWTIDVRVVDPDGVFTPNATVKAYENSIWVLGTESTGSNGSLVSFVGTQYSLTRSANYSYTPHRIEVTMTNYSNSTTFNMTGTVNLVVYDPTPDAFPGDITQDWDNDSDGYGDNISGNNPDYFPNDSTQWNDTDGDGYGDNQNGNNPDRLPNDATQWQDSDGDGFGDNQSGNNPDKLPNDPTQWQDWDGDGYGDNQSGNNPDAFTTDATQWSDADGDGYGDNASGNNPDAFVNDATQWNDTDGDGYGDNPGGMNPDAFPNDSTQFYDGDGDGLGDNQSGNNPDPYLNDSDNDGYDNSNDQFPWNPTQHEDLDNDGLGDNTSGTAADPYPNDTDNDGTNNTADPFPNDPTQDKDDDNDGLGDNQSGYNPDPFLDDTDNDGVNNTADDFPTNPTQTTDTDGDGWGDNQSGYPADAFPNDPAQWKDSDGDGYGDNSNATGGDAFPYDSTQWSDSDGDGYGDNPNGRIPDLYPNDSSQWSDFDGDGYGDNPNGTNPDAFPYDSTQWSDGDGDGYGDNPNGTLPDEYPNDSTQWSDYDGDGYGDNYYYDIDSVTGLRNQSGDAFPNDSSQWSDLDGDGYGDNPNGSNPDQYPYDSSQFKDSDSDTFPDNYSYSTNASSGLRENQIGDAFPDDSTQWSDIDGDGYGDNPNGNNPDIFPSDPTQWADADGDGLGDNPNGTNPDPTPGDSDNDGVPDYQDAFPYEPTQWSDTDGDGYGDNWGATTWTSLRPSGLPGRFVQNAVLVDYFPTIAAAHVDSDFDGFPDSWSNQDTGNNRAGLVLDACPLIYGNATTAGPGCPDGDGDNVADQDDSFPQDPTQWSDQDGDGYGDNPNGSFPDMFPQDPTQCCDRDGDGWGDNASADIYDAFPDDPTQWLDADGDGHGDNPNGSNPDLFPSDATQWRDNDGDGFGDDPNGNNPDPYPNDYDNDAYPDAQDDCPNQSGNSTYDSIGCLDSDGDGVSDAADLWPLDPSRSLDTDGDGVNDPEDAFPNDETQWIDNDNDGLGDNPNGNNPDPSLDDSDNDGYINQEDSFPSDSTQWEDLDGDGLGDSPSGNDPDPYPNDTDNDGSPNPIDLYPLNPDQSTDSDGDGWGDNPNGVDGDAYPLDPTQCCDSDGDGWGDNPNGTMADAFPLDPTQWMDNDRDGLGDNPNGSNPDPFPNDTDNDGVPNNQDSWPEDPEKFLDSDGDGIEDRDENFLMNGIPTTSAGSVMMIALLVGILAGIGGYFLGQRRGDSYQRNTFWGIQSDSSKDEMGENEI